MASSTVSLLPSQPLQSLSLNQPSGHWISLKMHHQ
jgi:hypothetical protein